jgi:hypothetical protein
MGFFLYCKCFLVFGDVPTIYDLDSLLAHPPNTLFFLGWIQSDGISQYGSLGIARGWDSEPDKFLFFFFFGSESTLFFPFESLQRKDSCESGLQILPPGAGVTQGVHPALVQVSGIQSRFGSGYYLSLHCNSCSLVTTLSTNPTTLLTKFWNIVALSSKSKNDRRTFNI